jgi:hypothetical protein
MSFISRIECIPLQSIKGGMAEFFTPQSSNETMLVNLPGGTIDDLFVHRAQTDQLLVVRGSFVLVALENRQYRYIPLSQNVPTLVRIPRGTPHGAINLSPDPCVLVNAVLRHGQAHVDDYVPRSRPYPYNLTMARTVLERAQMSSYRSCA